MSSGFIYSHPATGRSSSASAALFLALGAIPFPSTTRIVLAVIGAVIFLTGVVGWVLVEDMRMYPADSPHSGGEVHH